MQPLNIGLVAAESAIAVDDIGARTASKLHRRLIPLLFLLYVVAYLVYCPINKW
jgi:hypothetical protein